VVGVNSTDADPWIWVPDDACDLPLPMLSAAMFCASLAGQRVLLVGDSITGQFYYNVGSFVESHGLRSGSTTVACDSHPELSPGEQGCSGMKICNGAAELVFVRNDHLRLRQRVRDWRDYPVNVLLHPISMVLSSMRPTIVIMNRGAHFSPDEEYLPGLQDAVATVRETVPGATILLRSTPMGHFDCSSWSRPATRLEAEALRLAAPASYHWGDFGRQNALMAGVARDSGALFLHVAKLTSLRPDHHASAQDCLHYAMGGPILSELRLTAAAVALLRGQL
jgi:hypothetical protein